MKKSNEQQAARDLFFQTDHSQAEIARQVGVDPKTVNLWVKHGKWKEIKLAARRTPAILVEQYFNQLAYLNEAIEARPEGERYASPKEAETMRKLIVCINNIQKQTSLGANIDIMQNFISRIDRRDHDLAQRILPYGDEYLKSHDYKGIKSYEVAYDTGREETETLPSLREAGLASQPCATKQSHDDTGTPPGGQSHTNSPLEGGRPAAMNIDAGQGDVEARDEQSPIGETQHRQYIGNEQEIPASLRGTKQSQDDNGTPPGGQSHTNSPLEGGRPVAMNIDAGQGDVEARDEQSPTEETQHRQYIGNDQAPNSPLERGQGCVNTLDGQGLTEDLQAQHRQYIGNEQEIPASLRGTKQSQENTNFTASRPYSYPPRCTRDPDDPYTFYYDKITRRKFGSPKYGLPPEGFREVPKKDPLSKDYVKGAGRYNWF